MAEKTTNIEAIADTLVHIVRQYQAVHENSVHKTGIYVQLPRNTYPKGFGIAVKEAMEEIRGISKSEIKERGIRPLLARQGYDLLKEGKVLLGFEPVPHYSQV